MLLCHDSRFLHLPHSPINTSRVNNSQHMQQPSHVDDLCQLMTLAIGGYTLMFQAYYKVQHNEYTGTETAK